MCSWKAVAALGLVLALNANASGQGLFPKKPRPVALPGERVGEMLFTLRMSSDEAKRAAAAEGLRELDASQFPEIIPALADALKGDPKVSVRLEAAQSLGRIKPGSKMAHDALSFASSNDQALRVKWQAKTSLLYYQVSHLGGATIDPSVPAGPKDQKDQKSLINPTPVPEKFSQTPADQKPIVADDVARPLPKGPPQPAVADSQSAKPAPPPSKSLIAWKLPFKQSPPPPPQGNTILPFETPEPPLYQPPPAPAPKPAPKPSGPATAPQGPAPLPPQPSLAPQPGSSPPPAVAPPSGPGLEGPDLPPPPK